MLYEKKAKEMHRWVRTHVKEKTLKNFYDYSYKTVICNRDLVFGAD